MFNSSDSQAESRGAALCALAPRILRKFVACSVCVKSSARLSLSALYTAFYFVCVCVWASPLIRSGLGAHLTRSLQTTQTLRKESFTEERVKSSRIVALVTPRRLPPLGGALFLLLLKTHAVSMEWSRCHLTHSMSNCERFHYHQAAVATPLVWSEVIEMLLFFIIMVIMFGESACVCQWHQHHQKWLWLSLWWSCYLHCTVNSSRHRCECVDFGFTPAMSNNQFNLCSCQSVDSHSAVFHVAAV